MKLIKKNQKMMSDLPPQTATIRIQSKLFYGVKLFLNGEHLRTIKKGKEATLELPPGEYQLHGKYQNRLTETLMLKIQGGELLELQFDKIAFFQLWLGIMGSMFICLLLILLIPYVFYLLPGTPGTKGALACGIEMYPILFAAYQKEQQWGFQSIQLKVLSGSVESYQICVSPDFYKRTPIPLWLSILLIMLCIFILLDYVGTPLNHWISPWIYQVFMGH